MVARTVEKHWKREREDIGARERDKGREGQGKICRNWMTM